MARQPNRTTRDNQMRPGPLAAGWKYAVMVRAQQLARTGIARSQVRQLISGMRPRVSQNLYPHVPTFLLAHLWELQMVQWVASPSSSPLLAVGHVEKVKR